MRSFAGVSVDGQPWPVKDMAAYDVACRACERRVRITSQEQLRRLSAHLVYDKRTTPQALNGRGLVHNDFPELRLTRGMRLEPGADLQDIGDLEEMIVPAGGLELLFWDVPRTGLAKRRCPLFDGVSLTPGQLVPDEMHTLFLGVFQLYILALSWAVLEDNVYRMGGAGRMRDQLGIERFRVDLAAWYSAERRARPKTPLYELGSFDLTTIGSSRDKWTLHAKAAQTGTLLKFAVEQARRFRGSLASGEAFATTG